MEKPIPGSRLIRRAFPPEQGRCNVYQLALIDVKDGHAGNEIASVGDCRDVAVVHATSS